MASYSASIVASLQLTALWCYDVQKKDSTPQQHKDGMLSCLKGWNAPHIKSLIAQTPSDTLLLSRIYERYLSEWDLIPLACTLHTCLPLQLAGMQVSIKTSEQKAGSASHASSTAGCGCCGKAPSRKADVMVAFVLYGECWRTCLRDTDARVCLIAWLMPLPESLACCRQVAAGKPWFEGCLTGVGDCAHATRPDLAQGGAMAIEVFQVVSVRLWAV